MLKTGRNIIFYILLAMTQVHAFKSKDPVNLLMKLMSENEKPMVVYMDPLKNEPNNLIKLFASDDENGRDASDKDLTDDEIIIEKKVPNSLVKILADVKAKNADLRDDTSNDLDNLLISPDDELLEGYGDEQTLEEIAKNQAKYLIYSFLRTSPDQDTSLYDTKQYLRQALRSRCNKVTKCVKKCKVEKPSCPVNCQKVFDDLNLCEPPKEKKCNKPKCGRGKTMPPKWLLF